MKVLTHPIWLALVALLFSMAACQNAEQQICLSSGHTAALTVAVIALVLFLVGVYFRRRKSAVHLKSHHPIRKEIKLKNQVGELEQMLQFVENIGDELGLDTELVMNLKLVMEEMVSNIIFYAYPEGTEGPIELSVDGDEKELTFLLIDEGREYDPTLKEDPDLDVNPAERRLGGMGIFIAKNLMDSISYQRQNGKNLLTMKKNISTYDTNI